jgi:hypothetical protein
MVWGFALDLYPFALLLDLSVLFLLGRDVDLLLFGIHGPFAVATQHLLCDQQGLYQHFSL